MTLSQAVRGYIHFYEKIEPYADAYAISPFSLTTKHLDKVIEAVNTRFNTAFGVFEYTDENMKTLRNPDALTSESEKKRSSLKKEKSELFDRQVQKKVFERALEVYHRLEAKGIRI